MPQALAVEVQNNLPNTYGKIDITEAFKLRFQKHLTYKEIADRMGVAAPSVHGALKRFLHILHNPEESATYEQNRAQILTAVEFRLVNQLANKKKIKAASLNNIAYAVSQVNNMIRLEKGQATSITEHIDTDLSGMIDQLCGIKSAGSGSTVANSTHSAPVDILDSLSTVSITPQSEPADILASLEAPSTTIPTQVPGTDRAATGQPEPTAQPVAPAKRAKRAIKARPVGRPRKPARAKSIKSTVKPRFQTRRNFTPSLNSKDTATKQGTSAAPATDTLSAAGKEWYD
jgi:predicted DNA-binding protein YlxM (UPF0122 family)